MRLGTFLFSVFIVTILSVAYADSPKSTTAAAMTAEQGTAMSDVNSQVCSELSKRYPGARIELTSAIQWLMVGGATTQSTANSPQGEILSVRVGDENARGEVPFSVQSRDESGLKLSWGRVNFAAYVSARIAARRIQPGELVRPDGFMIQDINVAYGSNHEIRGLILQPSDALNRLETRQTILEGQPLLSSEIERVPDIRRGDSVRIELVTGTLTLSTLGTASEPGYLDGQIHVVSQKTKRELVGTLMNGGIVQVRL